MSSCNNRLNQSRTNPGPLKLAQCGNRGATRRGHHVFKLRRMQFLLLKQGCCASKGAMGKMVGQGPRQACRDCAEACQTLLGVAD